MIKKAKKERSTEGESLASTVNDIRSRFGEEAIMMLNEKLDVDVEALSTGSIGIDAAIGIGGLPKGRIIEIFGPESSGKTTLALHCIAEAQKLKMPCAFIDAEHALDPQYAKRLGVQTDKLLISQPSSGEEAMQICNSLVRGQKVGVIVIDSVAALTPRSEIEGEIGEVKIGAQARLMSQSMRVLTASIDKSKVIVIFINQIRMNINAMGFGANPETTAGGKALKFYASVRIEIRRIETLKSGDTNVGSRARVKIIKNKVASPFGVCEVDIFYGEGISRTGEALLLGEKHEVITKGGGGYSFGEIKLGRGYESSRKFLAENPQVLDEICVKVAEKMKQT